MLNGLFQAFERLTLRRVHPRCGTYGRICVHCEMEIAERAAFSVAETLTKRAQQIDVEKPELSIELMEQARSIYQGLWFEPYEDLAKLDQENR